jgi:hypothetical protein
MQVLRNLHYFVTRCSVFIGHWLLLNNATVVLIVMVKENTIYSLHRAEDRILKDWKLITHRWSFD